MILPQVAGKYKKINENHWPHKGIAELYRHRNRLIHIQYQRRDFIGLIPSRQETLKLYNSFIEAVEDMNVILGIIGRKRKTILKKLQV